MNPPFHDAENPEPEVKTAIVRVQRLEPGPTLEVREPAQIKAATNAWQWEHRRRPFIVWDERALQILRLGLYAAAVVERLAEEAADDLAALYATVGISRVSDAPYWTQVQMAFWAGQLCTRLVPVDVVEFVIAPKNHPATPAHMSRVAIRLDASISSMAASRPQAADGSGHILINPRRLTQGQHLPDVNRKQRRNLMAEWRGSFCHEATHLFHPGGSNSFYSYPSGPQYKDGDDEDYFRSPEEIIANAASHAAYLLTQGVGIETPEILKHILRHENSWSYYCKTFRDPNYVRRHPKVKNVARKFDWLTRRYYRFFQTHWAGETCRAQKLALEAW